MSASSVQINMKTSCIFCCTAANNSPSDIKTDEYWPYIQPTTWKGDPPLQTPPMCSICLEKVQEIAKCHREIVDLEQKLYMVRKQLDKAAKDVQERIEKCKNNQKQKQRMLVKRKASSKNVKVVKRSLDEMMAPASSRNAESFVGNRKIAKDGTGLPASKEEVNPGVVELSSSAEEEEDGDSSEDMDVTVDDAEVECDAHLESQVLEDLQDPLEGITACRPMSSKDLELLEKKKSLSLQLIVTNSNNPSTLQSSNYTIRKRSYDEMMRSSLTDSEKSVNTTPADHPPKIVNVAGSGYSSESRFQTFASTFLDDNDDYDNDSDYQLKEESDDSESDCDYDTIDGSMEKVPPEDLKDPLDAITKIEVLICSEDEANESKNSDALTLASLERLQQSWGICVICGVKLPLTDLSNHMKGHVGNYAFQCQSCSVTFPSRLSYSYHEKDHRRCCTHVTSKFKCELCDHEVGYKCALRHLQKIHETPGEKSFPCPMPSCVKTFTWKQTLELHLGTHELIARIYQRKYPVKKVEPWMEASWADDDHHEDIVTPPNQFMRRMSKRPCYICGIKLPVADLYEHMKGHVGDFAFQCKSCLVTFSSRLSLTYFSADHRQSCKDIPRSCNCDLCGQELRFGKALRSHFKRHEMSMSSKKKNFSCPIPSCEETFTHRQSLELHFGEHENKGKWFLESKQRIKTRPCEICGESIQVAKGILHEHIKSHVGEFAFQCPMEKCRLTFASRYTRACRVAGPKRTCEWNPPKHCEECNEDCENLQFLMGHLRRHETLEKNFTCPIANCGKEYTVRQSVEFHLASHAFRRKLQNCLLCRGKGKRSTPNFGRTPSDMESHLKEVHGVQNVVKCPHCPFVFPNQEDLIDHISNHGNVKGSTGVKCHLCSSNEIFRDGKILRRHFFQEHQIGKEYMCERCDFSSLSYRMFRVHQGKVHEGKKGRVYPCEICGDTPEFKSADDLRAHNIKLHNGEKYSCNFCPKCFNTRQSLEIHEKYKHRGVNLKTYPCSQCDKSFTKKSVLDQHLEIMHSVEAKYQCEKCEKAYKSQNSLNNHVKRSHESVGVVCEICGKSCKDKKILETHMRIHTGERPYLCKLCGLNFRQQSSLHNHTKAHERKGDKFVPKGTFDRTPREGP